MSEADASKRKAKRTRKSSATTNEIDQSDNTLDQSSLTNKQIVKLLNKGATEREIAAVTNLPKSTVHYKIQSLKKDPEFIHFKNNKADILEELQFKLASVVDHDLLKSMVSKRGMTDLAILEDKIRLMRGEATSITTIDIRALGVMVNLNPPASQEEVIDIQHEDN